MQDFNGTIMHFDERCRKIGAYTRSRLRSSDDLSGGVHDENICSRACHAACAAHGVLCHSTLCRSNGCNGHGVSDAGCNVGTIFDSGMDFSTLEQIAVALCSGRCVHSFGMGLV